jgi:hypothetical protein
MTTEIRVASVPEVSAAAPVDPKASLTGVRFWRQKMNLAVISGSVRAIGSWSQRFLQESGTSICKGSDVPLSPTPIRPGYETSSAIYAHYVALGHSASPNARKGFINFFHVSTRPYFANEGDVLIIGKDQRKLLLRCRKNVVDGIQGAINYLDIFHARYG